MVAVTFATAVDNTRGERFGGACTADWEVVLENTLCLSTITKTDQLDGWDGDPDGASQQYPEFSFTTAARCKHECAKLDSCKAINWRRFGIASFNCIPVLEWKDGDTSSQDDLLINKDWDCSILKSDTRSKGCSSDSSSNSSSDDSSSRNEPKECICTMDIAPVCGANGKTYSNACGAGCANVSVASEGECADPCANKSIPRCAKPEEPEGCEWTAAPTDNDGCVVGCASCVIGSTYKEAGGKGCQHQNWISDEGACHEAAKELGLTFVGAADFDSRPRGCFWDDRERPSAYFNRLNDGQTAGFLGGVGGICYAHEPAGECTGDDSRCGHNVHAASDWNAMAVVEQRTECTAERGEPDCEWRVQPAPRVSGLLAVKEGGVAEEDELVFRPNELVEITGDFVSWANANSLAIMLEASVNGFAGDGVGIDCDWGTPQANAIIGDTCTWYQGVPRGRSAGWQGWLNVLELLGDHQPKDEGRADLGKGEWYYDWTVPSYASTDYQANYYDKKANVTVVLPGIQLDSPGVSLRLRFDAVNLDMDGGEMFQTCFQDADLDGKCSGGVGSTDVTTIYSRPFKLRRPPAVTGIFSEGQGQGALQLDPGSVVEVEAARVDWHECTAIVLTLEASINNFGSDSCQEDRVCTWEQDSSAHRGQGWHGWLNYIEYLGSHATHVKPYTTVNIPSTSFYHDWAVPEWDGESGTNQARDYKAAYYDVDTNAFVQLPFLLTDPSVELRIRLAAAAFNATAGEFRETCFSDSNHDGECTEQDMTTLHSGLFRINRPTVVAPRANVPKMSNKEILAELSSIRSNFDILFGLDGGDDSISTAVDGGANANRSKVPITIDEYKQRVDPECTASRVDQCLVQSIDELLRSSLGADMSGVRNTKNSSAFATSTLPQLVERLGKQGADVLLQPLASNSSAAIDVKTESLHFSLLKWNDQEFPGLSWPFEDQAAAMKVIDTFEDEGEVSGVTFPAGASFTLPADIVAKGGGAGEGGATLTAAVAVYSKNASQMLFPVSSGGSGSSSSSSGSDDNNGDASDAELVSVVVSVQLPGFVEHGEELASNITLSFEITMFSDGDAGGGSQSAARQTSAAPLWNPSGCRGSWTAEGGAESSSAGGVQTYECSCNHLTHFAVLFKPDKAMDSSVHSVILTNFTYVGTGISLLCLLATFLAFAFLPQLRDTSQVILMHLVLAVALFQIFFLFVSPQTHVKNSAGNVEGTCKATAFLMHYTTLVAWMWMVIDGYYMRQRLVVVFTHIFPMQKVSLIAWGVPAVITAISFGVFYDDYGTADYCWIRMESPALSAFFLAPVFLGLLINIVVFVSIMCAISSDVADRWMMIKAAVTFSVTLSFYYIFGALSLAFPDSYVFDYLGAITMVLQGGLIFYFHCMGKPEVRHAIFSSNGRRLTLFPPSGLGGAKKPGNRSKPTSGGESGAGAGDSSGNAQRAHNRKHTDFGEDRSITTHSSGQSVTMMTAVTTSTEQMPSTMSTESSIGYFSVADDSSVNPEKGDVLMDMPVGAGYEGGISNIGDGRASWGNLSSSSNITARNSDTEYPELAAAVDHNETFGIKPNIRNSAIMVGSSSSGGGGGGGGGRGLGGGRRRLTDFTRPTAHHQTPPYVPAPSFNAELTEVEAEARSPRGSASSTLSGSRRSFSESATGTQLHSGGISGIFANRNDRSSQGSVGLASGGERRSSLV
eukprot:gene6562-31754_t